MDGLIQEIGTYIIISAAVFYVGRKALLMIRPKPEACEEESPGCRGCQLKESCQMTNSTYK